MTLNDFKELLVFFRGKSITEEGYAVLLASPAIKEFIRVAAAMKTIRDESLFVEQAASFEEFAQKEWGLSENETNQMIQIAEEANLRISAKN